MDTLIPVHTGVNGRARFAVPGLKKSNPFKRLLIRHLSAVKGVDRCSASTLTGRILVFYDSDLDINDLTLALLRIVLQIKAEIKSRTVQAEAEPGVKQKKKDRTRTKKIINSLKTMIKTRPGEKDINWHTRTGEEIVETFEGSIQKGLSQSRVPCVRAQYGENVLPKTQCRSNVTIFMAQLNSLPVYLLGAVAGISIVMGGILDSIIVSGVVLANAVIGYVTESRAEKNIDALNGLVHHMAEVIRDGKSIFVSAEAVVPGDLLVLKPGSFVPADSRIIQSSRLTIDESMLTGESLPVGKHADPILETDIPLADRKNMVYMGTCITGGQGLAVVVATGSNTEIGQLKALLNETRSVSSPIERQLDTIGDQLIYGCMAICGGVFVLGSFMGFGLLNMLRMSISLAAAAVPEGLPSIATVNFALGISRMKKNDVLVRRLPAAETLGAIQTICLDKTGTITMNRMKAISIYTGERWLSVTHDQLTGPNGRIITPSESLELEKLYSVCALCCETKINGRCNDGRLDISGSATESALTELVDFAGIDVKTLRKSAPLVKINHRSEKQLFMSTIHCMPDREDYLILVKGSPLEILSRCDTQIIDGHEIPLTLAGSACIRQANADMAGNALRVLGFACRTIKKDGFSASTHLETRLTWLGLVGLADPPRKGIEALISQFHRAGIRTVMITGDQQLSARAIAQQLNLSNNAPLEIMDAVELGAMDEDTLIKKARKVHVYSRVTPSQKLKIVKAIQAGGQTVAMTGDGINDGPALKAADIGIAMGGSGADLARDVADVVLTRDGLELLAASLANGRCIYQNIRKSVHYSLATNISEIQLMTASIALGLGAPLNVMQLLWINMISDILPGLALSLERPEGDVMETPPRNGEDPLFSNRDFGTMLLESSTITGGALISLIYGLSAYNLPAKAGGLAFHSLAVSQLLHSITCRSETAGVFTEKKLPSNTSLNWAIGLSVAAQALTLVFPPLRALLGLSRISLMDGLVISGGATLPLMVNEVSKAIKEKQGSARDEQSEPVNTNSRESGCKVSPMDDMGLYTLQESGFEQLSN
ncbi:MAG: HAD-IC family P-type ATPase [Desulfobacteraceae bacterium]